MHFISLSKKQFRCYASLCFAVLCSGIHQPVDFCFSSFVFFSILCVVNIKYLGKKAENALLLSKATQKNNYVCFPSCIYLALCLTLQKNVFLSHLLVHSFFHRVEKCALETEIFPDFSIFL